MYQKSIQPKIVNTDEYNTTAQVLKLFAQLSPDNQDIILDRLKAISSEK